MARVLTPSEGCPMIWLYEWLVVHFVTLVGWSLEWYFMETGYVCTLFRWWLNLKRWFKKIFYSLIMNLWCLFWCRSDVFYVLPLNLLSCKRSRSELLHGPDRDIPVGSVEPSASGAMWEVSEGASSPYISLRRWSMPFDLLEQTWISLSLEFICFEVAWNESSKDTLILSMIFLDLRRTTL